MNIGAEIKDGAPVEVTIKIGDYEWVYKGELDTGRRDSDGRLESRIGLEAVDPPYPEDPWLTPVVLSPNLWDIDVRLRVRQTGDHIGRITERGDAARRTRELRELQARHRRERGAT
jgi:hypothetical protein